MRYGLSIRKRIVAVTPLQWFVALALIAIVLALVLPPDPHSLKQLHTSATSYRLAVALLLIPYIFIWYTSFYAFAKLREYAASIEGSKDGNAFKKITTGMGVLSFSLVVPTIISLVLNNIASHNRAFEPAGVIITNYIGIFPGLLAFLILYNGAHMLLRTARGGIQKLDLRWHAPWFLLLSVVFSHLAIENYYRSNPYHLTLWLLVGTFIVPYLYGWAVGLLGAYDFYIYSQTVHGSVYKKAIKQFAGGITVAIFGSIAIQFVNITLAKRFGGSLGAVLLIDYILLIIVAVGLLLMSLGTKKLKKFEEV